jgi:ABC-2 type transport system permease protein
MKLWHSFVKEILLATRSFYFYIEIAMAGLFLFLLLFVVPENFDTKTDEYLFFDGPIAAFELFEEELLREDEDHQSEIVKIEWEDEVSQATLYESEGRRSYLLDDLDKTISIADKERVFAAVMHINESGDVRYSYYLQGYESERLRNSYAVFNNEPTDVLIDAFDAQEVRILHENQILLSDRQNILPSFLTFNGSLMGMFLLAAYIFLDKKEGVITAYAVTTSPVWQYLLSKAGMVTFTSMITSFIITVPVMGRQPNYLAMFIFLLTTGFAASALGLLLSSYYDDLMQAFGAIFIIVVGMMLPNFAYFIPTWDLKWIQYIPSYAILEGFKEILLINGDVAFVMYTSAGFLIAGLLLFFFANSRFRNLITK